MSISTMWLRLFLFVFHWVQDEDGDIGLQFFRLITFVKYKEHTLVYFGRKNSFRKNWKPAPKYVRS